MGGFGNENDDFTVSIQSDGLTKVNEFSPAIEQGSGVSYSSNIELFLDPDDSLPPPNFGNFAEQTGGGISQSEENTYTFTAERYDPGEYDPANTEFFNNNTLNEETLAAISSAYAAEAFNLIARRGINPIRAEVLGVHEFVPVAKGEDFLVNQSSITLNFGADNPVVVVNQVVRLIELHRTLIQTANLLSEQLISNASGFTKDQIDGGILRAHYDMTNVTGYFDSVFEAAYPYGNIFDSDVDVILNKFVDGFFQVKDSGQYPFTIGLINLEPYSLSDSAINFGFSNLDQLDSNLISSENSDNDFSKAAAKLAIIKTLIPSIVSYMKDIIGIQGELNNAINFTNFDLQTATNNSDNYSKIISICMTTFGLSSFEDTVSSFLSFGTGVSGSPGSNNTINFLNVISKLYSECLFMRSPIPGSDSFGANISINSDYDYVDESISDKVILSSEKDGPNKIKNGIEQLRRFYPYTSNVYKTSVFSASSRDIGSAYYSNVNGPGNASGAQDYSNRGRSISEDNVSNMLVAVDNDIDTALTRLVAAICYDQVVGANVNIRSVGSNISPPSVSENNGTGIFPAMNIFRKILYRDPGFSTSISVTQGVDFQNLISKEVDDDLVGIFSNLTNFAKVAIGLNSDPNNSSGRYVPLDYNNELTADKKSAVNFNGSVRLGPSLFFLDAVISADSNLQTLDSFIDEFESEFHKVRNFIIDYYSLGFDSGDSDGFHNSQYGSAGKISANLNPLSYFYWYMDKLADELEAAIDLVNTNSAGHAENAINLALFAESGQDVETMLRAFKSAYFGFLASKGNSFCNPDMDVATVNKIFQLFCYRTDRAMIDLMEGLLSGLGIRSDELAFSNETAGSFTSWLSNDKDWFTDDKFDEVSTNQRFGYKDEDVYVGDSFSTIGNRDDSKPIFQSAIGLYEGTFEDDSFGGYGGRLRGIRPAYESTYLYHVFRNTPIVGGLYSAVSESRFKDHFLNNAFSTSTELNNGSTATNLYDRPVANPGQFGGIFSTSSFQRALIFYMLAMRIYRMGVSVNLDLRDNSNDGSLRYNVAKNFARGTVAALRRGSREDVPAYNNGNDNTVGAITEGFRNTQSFVIGVTTAIRSKRNAILQPLAFFEKVIKNLKDLRSSAQDILNVSVSLNNDTKRYLAGSLIQKSGILSEDNIVALNEITAATLHKSLINHFQAPVDSNISKLVSVYDSFAINDVKLMYKVLSQPGYGYNSDEKYGKKNIIHIGVPLGMLTALRSMSVDATDDQSFENATKIAVHVTKKDELNPDVVYWPRTFVFDMSRFILPKGPSGLASNHIANYSDSWSFQDILTNMKVYYSSDGGLDDVTPPEHYAGMSDSNSLDYSLHVNHVFDYYLKMYCRLTTGLDFDEESFKVFSSKLFNGSVDANMQQFFNDYTNNLVQLYPSANVNPDSAIAFTRALNVSKNYTIFSPFSRLESALSINCFDRIFSIMVNERDFLAPLDLYGADSTDVFINDPNVYPDGRTQVGPTKLSVTEIDIADGQSLFDSNAQLGDKLDEYLKGLNPDTTHVSKYSIQISLLKG